MRIVTVGLLWSVFFLEGVRVIMLKNWRFDMLRPSHWQYTLDLWLSGWVIDEPKEWAFVLILLTFIPLWLTGWATLSLVNWGRLTWYILGLPLKVINRIFSNQAHALANKVAAKTVIKKKSYKEIRPQSRGGDFSNSERSNFKENKSPPQNKPSVSNPQPTIKKQANFDHALFDFDDDGENFDFNLDEPIVSKAPAAPKKESKPEAKKEPEKKPQKNNDTPPPAAQKNSNNNSITEVLKQKGYDWINNVSIKNSVIDFIAVSKDTLYLCLLDKEAGDWLADEEKFNDEEPLWFSESSHRISPVRKVEIASEILTEKLEGTDFKMSVKPFVVNQLGNIINAEDMFETWEQIGVEVTRIDRGTPKELKLFSKTIESAEGRLEKDKLEKLKKIIRGIN